MNDKIANIERLGQIERELQRIYPQITMIRAQHTKDVYLEKSPDGLAYNLHPRVKEAELTLRLGNDTKLQTLIQQTDELEVEDQEVGVDTGNGGQLWFSDRLKSASGKTFAEEDEIIAKDERKSQIGKNSVDPYEKGTAGRLKQINDAKMIEKINEIAIVCFETLGCRHLGRVDMIIDPAGQIYVIEINTLPGFTSHSLLPKAAEKMGIPSPKLCEMITDAAWKDRENQHG